MVCSIYAGGSNVFSNSICMVITDVHTYDIVLEFTDIGTGLFHPILSRCFYTAIYLFDPFNYNIFLVSCPIIV